MSTISAFSGHIDLAQGGRILGCTDDFFAEAANLLKPEPAVFIPGKYTDRGKWMDGWESRRRRVPGHDWCVLALGLPGVVRGVDIDTAHFLGNHPPFASLEGCHAPADATLDDLEAAKAHLATCPVNAKWAEWMGPIMKIDIDPTTQFPYLLPLQFHMD